jgi:hypothetical protein
MFRRISQLAAGLIAIGTSGIACAQIAMFEGPQFEGRVFRSDNSVSNLAEAGFNDRASSIVVEGGRWQICGDAFFEGRCVTLDPGRYPSMRALGLENSASSVRELGWTPDRRGGWGRDEGRRWGDERTWGAGNRAVLFAGRNMSGPAHVVDPGGVSNLESVGFNDRAMSMRIESGYWLFCTDANYQGDCHTYGPGDYPNLPNGQDHRLSSGRRVSSDYPYRQSPRWRQ